MSDKIIFDVKVEGDSRWFGRIHLSNIRHEDGSPVKINRFNVTSDPWMEFASEYTSTDIDDSTVAVRARLKAPEPLTITDTFTIGINVPGDLTGDSKRYTESIVVTVATD